MRAVLTASDHGLLRQMLLEVSGSGTPLEAMLRRKLNESKRLEPGDRASFRVRPGVRVRFQISDRRPHDRVLVMPADYIPDGRCLSLDSPAGLALLGLARGEEALLDNPEGEPGRIRVLDIYAPDTAPARTQSSAEIIPFPVRAPAYRLGNGPGPGPSAV